MSIQSEISRITTNIAESYTAVSAKGGTLPEVQNSDNLATAIESISGGSEPVIQALSVTANGTYTAPSGVDGYSPVVVNVAGSGVHCDVNDDVVFFDMDGTPVISYSKEDFALLTNSTYPKADVLPAHTGLTFAY